MDRNLLNTKRKFIQNWVVKKMVCHDANLPVDQGTINSLTFEKWKLLFLKNPKDKTKLFQYINFVTNDDGYEISPISSSEKLESDNTHFSFKGLDNKEINIMNLFICFFETNTQNFKDNDQIEFNSLEAIGESVYFFFPLCENILKTNKYGQAWFLEDTGIKFNNVRQSVITNKLDIFFSTRTSSLNDGTETMRGYVQGTGIWSTNIGINFDYNICAVGLLDTNEISSSLSVELFYGGKVPRLLQLNSQESSNSFISKIPEKKYYNFVEGSIVKKIGNSYYTENNVLINPVYTEPARECKIDDNLLTETEKQYVNARIEIFSVKNVVAGFSKANTTGTYFYPYTKLINSANFEANIGRQYTYYKQKLVFQEKKTNGDILFKVRNAQTISVFSDENVSDVTEYILKVTYSNLNFPAVSKYPISTLNDQIATTYNNPTTFDNEKYKAPLTDQNNTTIQVSDYFPSSSGVPAYNIFKLSTTANVPITFFYDADNVRLIKINTDSINDPRITPYPFMYYSNYFQGTTPAVFQNNNIKTSIENDYFIICVEAGSLKSGYYNYKEIHKVEYNWLITTIAGDLKYVATRYGGGASKCDIFVGIKKGYSETNFKPISDGTTSLGLNKLNNRRIQLMDGPYITPVLAFDYESTRYLNLFVNEYVPYNRSYYDFNAFYVADTDYFVPLAYPIEDFPVGAGGWPLYYLSDFSLYGGKCYNLIAAKNQLKLILNTLNLDSLWGEVGAPGSLKRGTTAQYSTYFESSQASVKKAKEDQLIKMLEMAVDLGAIVIETSPIGVVNTDKFRFSVRSDIFAYTVWTLDSNGKVIKRINTSCQYNHGSFICKGQQIIDITKFNVLADISKFGDRDLSIIAFSMLDTFIPRENPNVLAIENKFPLGRYHCEPSSLKGGLDYTVTNLRLNGGLPTLHGMFKGSRFVQTAGPSSVSLNNIMNHLPMQTFRLQSSVIEFILIWEDAGDGVNDTLVENYITNGGVSIGFVTQNLYLPKNANVEGTIPKILSTSPVFRYFPYCSQGTAWNAGTDTHTLTSNLPSMHPNQPGWFSYLVTATRKTNTIHTFRYNPATKKGDYSHVGFWYINDGSGSGTNGTYSVNFASDTANYPKIIKYENVANFNTPTIKGFSNSNNPNTYRSTMRAKVLRIDIGAFDLFTKTLYALQGITPIAGTTLGQSGEDIALVDTKTGDTNLLGLYMNANYPEPNILIQDKIFIRGSPGATRVFPPYEISDVDPYNQNHIFPFIQMGTATSKPPIDIQVLYRDWGSPDLNDYNTLNRLGLKHPDNIRNTFPDPLTTVFRPTNKVCKVSNATIAKFEQTVDVNGKITSLKLARPQKANGDTITPAGGEVTNEWIEPEYTMYDSLDYTKVNTKITKIDNSQIQGINQKVTTVQNNDGTYGTAVSIKVSEDKNS